MPYKEQGHGLSGTGTALDLIAQPSWPPRRVPGESHRSQSARQPKPREHCDLLAVGCPRDCRLEKGPADAGTVVPGHMSVSDLWSGQHPARSRDRGTLVLSALVLDRLWSRAARFGAFSLPCHQDHHTFSSRRTKGEVGRVPLSPWAPKPARRPRLCALDSSFEQVIETLTGTLASHSQLRPDDSP